MKRLVFLLTACLSIQAAPAADLLAVYQRALQNDPQLREAEANRLAALEAKPQAVAALAKELLEQEATGDRARVEAWFTKYGTIPPELSKALESASDVPVDIDPISSFPEPMR